MLSESVIVYENVYVCVLGVAKSNNTMRQSQQLIRLQPNEFVALIFVNTLEFCCAGQVLNTEIFIVSLNST